ncbi:MAG: TPR repeat protein [Cognaticolwellia sp.]|jgi:TPR repeat protein
MLLLATLIFATQDRSNCAATDSAKACLDAGLYRSYESVSGGKVSFELGCEKGSEQACFFRDLDRYATGETSLVLSANAQALSELQARCSVGRTQACYHLGLLHVDGPIDYRDSSQGNMLLRQACDGGAYDACLLLAEPLTRSSDAGMKEQARGLYRKGCDGRHAKSCLALLGQIDAGSDEAGKVRAQACKAGADSVCK